MNLKFPELRGGPVQGLNDAGVENFQGAVDVYLSRECGQNTADAPRLGAATVRLEFDRLDVPAAEIPGFTELRATLRSCLERWKDKEKEREFFEQAIDIASKDEIVVLKISDYQTTGLTGDDLDEQGRWFALVKSQGVSNKGDTAGGSFGIGKSSPFAASRFRTVFYGTRTESGQVALQGVSRLVTHKNTDGKLTQGTGFIGQYDEAGGENGEPVFRAIRDEGSIPARFRRTEIGTDIWIVGYRSGPGWSDDLIRSILSNFWPAIHRGTIEFRVGAQNISKANLDALIRKHVGHEEFDAHHYYKAVQSQPIKKTLAHTGACELYLSAASSDLPRKICMVRKTGMRIFDYQPKACRVPFSGLFFCTDQEGNKLLRKLEPPKHNTWDPKRIEDKTGRQALDEIKIWIREEVKKLNPLFAGSSFNENELAKYVADTVPDDPTDLADDKPQVDEEESLESKPANENPLATPIQAKPVAPETDGTSTDGAGTQDGGGGGGGGDGSGMRRRRKRKRNRKGTKGGSKSDELAQPSISVRSYKSDENGTYELVLRSDANFEGAVRVLAVGEDGLREEVSLAAAKIPGPDGKSFPVKRDSIQNVTLTAGVPLRLSVSIQEIERRSLTATTRS